MDGVDEQTERYLGMIEVASVQLSELLEQLGLVARIEDGRWEPLIGEADSLALAHAAAEPHGGAVVVSGTGTQVAVDEEAAARALGGLAHCARRHGGLDEVELRVDGASIAVAPVAADVAAICLGLDLKDLGAAVGTRALVALGAAVEAEDETVVVRLPLAPVVS